MDTIYVLIDEEYVLCSDYFFESYEDASKYLIEIRDRYSLSHTDTVMVRPMHTKGK